MPPLSIATLSTGVAPPARALCDLDHLGTPTTRHEGIIKPHSVVLQESVGLLERGVMTSSGSKDWQRIAAAVRARRLELGLTQQGLAAEAGVSLTTVNLLEAGKQTSYRDLTLAAVARALGWPSTAFSADFKADEDGMGGPGDPRLAREPDGEMLADSPRQAREPDGEGDFVGPPGELTIPYSQVTSQTGPSGALVPAQWKSLLPAHEDLSGRIAQLRPEERQYLKWLIDRLLQDR